VLEVAGRFLDQEVTDERVVQGRREPDQSKFAPRDRGRANDLLGKLGRRPELADHQVIVRFGRLSHDDVRASNARVKRQR
jgi:hypothetical protein